MVMRRTVHPTGILVVTHNYLVLNVLAFLSGIRREARIEEV
jgi:hypothetical protein